MGTDIKPTKNLPGSKPARGRPATGRDSNAAYTASSRINLVEGGGKRLEVRLTPDGHDHLRLVLDDRAIDQTQAVHQLLAEEAGRIRRKRT